jgi:nucleoside-diphosphate-sugar epimerase
VKVLYIGGTGEVSYGCLQASLELGHEVWVFNRGTSGVALPPGARSIVGDLRDDPAYAALANRSWDAVCQFRCFTPNEARRDIDTFAGHARQYVFISSASAYQKPQTSHVITEQTPLANPFSQYARDKAACERVLLDAHAAGRLPVTIVRPSHTNRLNFPGTLVPGDHWAWRMLQGKPVISHGDGASLWTLTRGEDFGAAFARLLGQASSLGEAYHITSDENQAWDRIFEFLGEALGVAPQLVHVATDTLVAYEPQWEAGLRGDKAWSVQFDNTKIKQAAPGWECRHTMREAIAMAAPHVSARMAGYQPDPGVDELIDRIIAEQQALK